LNIENSEKKEIKVEIENQVVQQYLENSETAKLNRPLTTEGGRRKRL